jgi:hypothetical protein
MAQAYKVGEGTYKGPLSVRSDVPQEDGITFIQTDAGKNNDMFAIQHYNGGWSDQGLDLPAVNTDELFTEARGPSVTVHVTSDGEIVADGPNSQIASGDFNTPADVTTVLQAAIDAGGHILIREHSSDYGLAAAGTDANGEPYCLKLKPDTYLEIAKGATITYANVDSSLTPPDVASVVLASGISNFKITLDGTLDGGYHLQPQPDDHDNDVHVLKIGEKEKGNQTDITGTGCSNFVIEGSGTITGGVRHGIEIGASAEDLGSAGRGVIRDLTADDGGGDDDFCIGGPVSHVRFERCVSHEKNRSGKWGSSGFEMDDGPRDCYFVNCDVVDPQRSDIDGYLIGKTHPWVTNSAYDTLKNQVINCTASGCRWAFASYVEGGQSSDNIFQNVTAEDSTYGIYMHGDSDVSSWQVLNSTIKNCDVGVMVEAFTGTHEDIFVDSGTTIEECGWGIRYIATGTSEYPSLHPTVSNCSNGGIQILNNASDYIESLEVSGATIRDCDGAAVALDGNTIDSGTALYRNAVVENNQLINNSSGVSVGADLSSSNWQGDCWIRNNRMQGNSTQDIKFYESAPKTSRKILLTIHNDTGWDLSSVVPTNKPQGTTYFDDGTNTSSGDNAYRYYNGASWVDM